MGMGKKWANIANKRHPRLRNYWMNATAKKMRFRELQSG